MLEGLNPAYVARVVVESDTTSRARMAISGEEALDPMQMLERWVETRNIQGELRQRMLELGRALIQRQRERERGGS
jgi:hypothetical protein